MNEEKNIILIADNQQLSSTETEQLVTEAKKLQMIGINTNSNLVQMLVLPEPATMPEVTLHADGYPDEANSNDNASGIIMMTSFLLAPGNILCSYIGAQCFLETLKEYQDANFQLSELYVN